MKSLLNNEMKKYENKYRLYIDKDDFYVLRMDGCNFKNFTKPFEKPFDIIFRNTMKQTMFELCKEIQCSILGFTQSDEITIILKKRNENSQIPYNGNIQKIVSVYGSKTSVLFNKYFYEECKKYNKLKEYDSCLFNAEFDCRFFTLSESKIYDCLKWRWQDCKRNAINMIARCYFSHKYLENKKTNEIIDILKSKNINIDNYKPEYIYGVICYKKKVLLNKNTERECERFKWFFDNNLCDIISYKDYLLNNNIK